MENDDSAMGEGGRKGYKDYDARRISGIHKNEPRNPICSRSDD
jgi:hypothetical protein